MANGLPHESSRIYFTDGGMETTFIFLDGIDCTIQAVKPRQCRGFPNEWNFAGWRKHCEAVPVAVPLPENASSEVQSSRRSDDAPAQPSRER